MDRREALKNMVTFPLLAAAGAGAAAGTPAAEDARFVVEARFYEKMPSRRIRCKLCPRECVIDDRERGYCGVRENRGGTYYSLVYGRICSAHVDPIEKKPLFHFAPGSLAFSIATAGCNVNCKMCQNWEISQARPEQLTSTYMPPQKLAAAARESHAVSIAYTYNEPVIFCELRAWSSPAATSRTSPSRRCAGASMPSRSTSRHTRRSSIARSSTATSPAC
jgi:hypothetical protein